MKKNQKNDVSNSTMSKGYLDKFMEEFFKVENECDLECFYELLNKCFLEDCKTNLKNHKIACFEEMKLANKNQVLFCNFLKNLNSKFEYANADLLLDLFLL